MRKEKKIKKKQLIRAIKSKDATMINRVIDEYETRKCISSIEIIRTDSIGKNRRSRILNLLLFIRAKIVRRGEGRNEELMIHEERSRWDVGTVTKVN